MFYMGFLLFRKGYKSKVSSLWFVFSRQLKVLSLKAGFWKTPKEDKREKSNSETKSKRLMFSKRAFQQLHSSHEVYLCNLPNLTKACSSFGFQVRSAHHDFGSTSQKGASAATLSTPLLRAGALPWDNTPWNCSSTGWEGHSPGFVPNLCSCGTIWPQGLEPDQACNCISREFVKCKTSLCLFSGSWKGYGISENVEVLQTAGTWSWQWKLVHDPDSESWTCQLFKKLNQQSKFIEGQCSVSNSCSRFGLR